MVEARPENAHLPDKSPVLARAENFRVPNDPVVAVIPAPGSAETPDRSILTVAPKAPAPWLLTPTPRCTWISPAEAATSGKSTQKTPWLSASLKGTPLIVTFVRVGSLPRIRRPV